MVHISYSCIFTSARVTFGIHLIPVAKTYLPFERSGFQKTPNFVRNYLTKLSFLRHVLQVQAPRRVFRRSLARSFGNLHIPNFNGRLLQHTIEISDEFEHHAGANIPIRTFVVQFLHKCFFFASVLICVYLKNR